MKLFYRHFKIQRYEKIRADNRSEPRFLLSELAIFAAIRNEYSGVVTATIIQKIGNSIVEEIELHKNKWLFA
jgi:hypothetical protein